MKTFVFPLCIGLAALTLLCHCAAPSGTSADNKAALTSATKEQPFVNSLGMKFVPVPGTNVLMCTTETTVAQYQAAGVPSRPPGFPQGPNHPVVEVQWEEAKAWCRWLSSQEKRKYRLPTVAEWKAAAGSSLYPWGNQWPPPPKAGNYLGQEHRSTQASKHFFTAPGRGFESGSLSLIAGYRDSHIFTASVGSYQPNVLGIYDLGGNVKEQCNESRYESYGSGWAFENPFYPKMNNYVQPDRERLMTANRSGGFGFDEGFRVVVER